VREIFRTTWLASNSNVEVFSLWAITRALALACLALPAEHRTLTDLVLYHDVSLKAWDLGQLPGQDYPWEYPPGAFAVVLMPRAISDQGLYSAAFAGLCLALDAVVLWMLTRRNDQASPSAGTWIWLLAVPALGPTAFLRLDMPAVCVVVLALLVLRSNPALAGALLVVGASIKLWPVALLVALLFGPYAWRKLLVGASAAAVLLTALSLGLGTAGALRTALTVQQDRGVQIESVPALPWMWARALGQGPDVAFRWYSTEVDASRALTGSLVWTALLGLGVVVILWTTRHASLPFTTAALTVSALLLANKVFSPQYLLWLIGVCAVSATELSSHRRKLLALCIGMAALSHLVFPIGYTEYVNGGVMPLLLITSRDVLLAVAAWTFYSTLRAQR
jgi:hypothetical protein